MGCSGAPCPCMVLGLAFGHQHLKSQKLPNMVEEDQLEDAREREREREVEQGLQEICQIPPRNEQASQHTVSNHRA